MAYYLAFNGTSLYTDGAVTIIPYGDTWEIDIEFWIDSDYSGTRTVVLGENNNNLLQYRGDINNLIWTVEGTGVSIDYTGRANDVFDQWLVGRLKCTAGTIEMIINGESSGTNSVFGNYRFEHIGDRYVGGGWFFKGRVRKLACDHPTKGFNFDFTTGTGYTLFDSAGLAGDHAIVGHNNDNSHWQLDDVAPPPLSISNAEQGNQAAALSAAQLHKLTAAVAAQLNQAQTASLLQVVGLNLATASQVNQASVLSAIQRYLLDTTKAQQDNQAAGLSVVQLHQLSAAIADQLNQALQLGTNMRHLLDQAIAEQPNQAAGLSAVQLHKLTAALATQLNQALTQSIQQQGGLILHPAEQSNQALNATVSQTHIIGLSQAAQANEAYQSAVVQVHTLGIMTAAQLNESLQNAVTQLHQLQASSASQVNQAAAQSLAQIEQLITAIAEQSNQANQPILLQLHELSSASASQFNQAVSMRIFTGLIQPVDPDSLALISISEPFELFAVPQNH